MSRPLALGAWAEEPAAFEQESSWKVLGHTKAWADVDQDQAGSSACLGILAFSRRFLSSQTMSMSEMSRNIE